jgi:hypothetical protein
MISFNGSNVGMSTQRALCGRRAAVQTDLSSDRAVKPHAHGRPLRRAAELSAVLRGRLLGGGNGPRRRRRSVAGGRLPDFAVEDERDGALLVADGLLQGAPDNGLIESH